MTTWRLLGGVGLLSVMLGLGCNGNSLGGGTDPNCPDPNNCTNPNPVPDFNSLNIMPNQVTLNSQDGSKPTQQFVITGVRTDGSVTDPLSASFTVPANGIGTVDPSTGLFTATGEIGGTITITATVISNGVPVSGSFQVTVNVNKNIIVAGTPADAASHFTGASTADNTKAGGIVYPLNNVVFPQNVYPADIQWTNGVMNDIYRVQITKPNFSMTAYVLHTGAAFKLDYIPDAKSWAGAAQTSPDSDATLTVDRWDSVGNKVYTGNPVAMHFAKGSLLGSLYYWDINVGRIRRIDDGTATSVNFMPTPPTSPVSNESCMGCHVVSRDGRYMIGRLGGGDNVGGIFDLTVSQSPTAVPTYPITSGLQKFWFSTWKPDNTRIFGSETPGGAANSNVFYLINTTNGAVVTPTTGALPTKGTQPNWSPDGNNIVYVSEANSWGGDSLVTSNLSILPVTGPDAFGTAKKIHTSTSITGSTVDTYPTWSPDSKWVAFHNGSDGRSDDNKDGALYLISPDGTSITKLGKATDAGSGTGLGKVYFPNFSPFNVGGYFWLAYVSNRTYGNSKVGTMGSEHQQMWVSAVKNSPNPGEDPSCVPYWLPGQVTTAKNISAYWAPKACRLDNDSCSTGSECCSGVCTGNKCQPPPNRCLMAGETCGGSGCCGSLICDAATHICQGGAG